MTNSIKNILFAGESDYTNKLYLIIHFFLIGQKALYVKVMDFLRV